MDLTPLKIASLILKHNGIAICIVGELALNYYNVPRVCHDIEICITKSGPLAAAELLCSTGLFEIHRPSSDFDNFTEYKRGFPRVRTTNWCQPQSLTIFTASFFGLDPVEDVLIPHIDPETAYISKEIKLNQNDIPGLQLPRLAPLLKGLVKRFLDTRDDIAMIAVEQLVDGMNLDETWVIDQLGGSSSDILELVLNQVRGKKSRIDYFTENKITCFIADQEEAESVRLIPGLY